MRSIATLLKKEFIENIRTYKLIILCLVFILVGFFNTAFAKLTPIVFELLSDTIAETGMVIEDISVSAYDAWVQFYKNIPIMLIVTVIVYSATFTKEYQTGTLILAITKGLSRYKIVISKTVIMLTVWTAGFWLCFGTTYIANTFFWDSYKTYGLLPSAVLWWVFGIWVLSLISLFSSFMKNQTSVLLGVGAVVFASIILGYIENAGRFLPTSLMSGAQLIIGKAYLSDLILPLVLTCLATALDLIISVFILNKREF